MGRNKMYYKYFNEQTTGKQVKQILVDMITLGYELNPKESKKFRKEAKDVIFFEKINTKKFWRVIYEYSAF